ncbi:uncharacterized protein LOC135223800 [Macrobrachium nipponense]|uniref:uncharacterized protein LOC135223800 n=1 Tax=Macrobrachium nipponense TaxID=159736 RepID=UPI0030C869B9
MDLEVSISLADAALSEVTDMATDSQLSPFGNPQCDSSDSGQYEIEPDLSEGSAEENDVDGNRNRPMAVDDVDGNKNRPMSVDNVDENMDKATVFDENKANPNQNCISADDNAANNLYDFYIASNVKEIEPRLPEIKGELKRNITTNDGNALVIKTSSDDSKPTIKLSRNSSFQGPMITSIRIGAPKRSASMDGEELCPPELEYTISVSGQNNVTLQMTTAPSLRKSTCDKKVSTQNNCELQLLGGNSAEMAEDGPLSEHEILVGNQTVRLRPKKTHSRNGCATNSHSSQTEAMKRHSAEISQLRHALEQKINRNSPHRRSYHDSPYGNRRPLSAVGYSSLCGTPIKENRRPRDSATCIRRSVSHMSSPLHWRNDAKNSVHVTDQKKLEFLSDGHQDFRNSYESGLCNEYHNIIGSNTRGSPCPQSYCDHFCPERNNRHCNTCTNKQSSYPYFCENEENITCRNKNLHNSLGVGSTCSQHKRTNTIPGTMTDATQATGPTVEDDGRVNYYPNCDATIWLRSCEQEVTEPLSGEQIGQVPHWISGALIRNGPGRLTVGDQKYNHLFDGSALLHRFHFKKGKVTYQNKFLRSRSYLRDTKAQRIVVNYFGTRAHPDPCRTILQNIASKFDFEEHFTDNAQISLYPYGDGLYALTETPFIFRVDPDTLNTHEKVDLTKYLAVMTHTAHPHVDRDGTVYNIGQGVGPLGPKYHICKFPNPKADKRGKVKSPFDQAQIVGSVGARWRLNPCYMHSFSMTENYWVIIEQPLVVSVPKILRVVIKQDALIDALQWYEKETKIHVIRRDTGATITTQYVTETFFFLHTINAYEDRGHIVLDIATYRNAEMLHCMYVEALKNASYDPSYARMFRGRPKRWVIPLRPNKDASVGTNLVTLPDTKCQGRWLKKNVIYLTPELLADIGCEVPRIHYEKHNGRPYQYFYAICSDVDHPNPGTLVKVDVVSKTHLEWSEDNIYPSEPVFVPHPLGKNEDDGVVLSALLRAKGLDNQVCMVILDAATFTLRARVEFLAPGPVPKCLHGWFVPEGTLKVHRKEQENISNKEE